MAAVKKIKNFKTKNWILYWNNYMFAVPFFSKKKYYFLIAIIYYGLLQMNNASLISIKYVYINQI